MRVAIVTDSTSDITTDLAQENDIQVVPALLNIDNRSFEDGRGISRAELYRQLPEMKTSPTTAAPASGTFQNIYQELLSRGTDYVISIHVSSALSGIYNSALVAAKSFGSRVHVIDSCHVTLGLGFQVLAAARAVREGINIKDISGLLAELRKRIQLVAMLDTLEYARRSGRISWARSSIGTLFQIKPFVGVQDGKVIRMGETRTRQKGIERLQEMLADLGPLDQMAVLHTNAEADALRIVERFKSMVKNNPLVINVTSIIGVHVGPNGLGFVAVTEK